MHFRLVTHPGKVDLAAIDRELRAIDAAAIVDFDGARGQVRVSTFLSVPELIDVVDRAGCRVTPGQVIAVKSECCGGCGG
jgi:hypothetical protein